MITTLTFNKADIVKAAIDYANANGFKVLSDSDRFAKGQRIQFYGGENEPKMSLHIESPIPEPTEKEDSEFYVYELINSQYDRSCHHGKFSTFIQADAQAEAMNRLTTEKYYAVTTLKPFPKAYHIYKMVGGKVDRTQCFGKFVSFESAKITRTNLNNACAPTTYVVSLSEPIAEPDPTPKPPQKKFRIYADTYPGSGTADLTYHLGTCNEVEGALRIRDELKKKYPNREFCVTDFEPNPLPGFRSIPLNNKNPSTEPSNEIFELFGETSKGYRVSIGFYRTRSAAVIDLNRCLEINEGSALKYDIVKHFLK